MSNAGRRKRKRTNAQAPCRTAPIAAHHHREHHQREQRRGQVFWLTDQSTNHTFSAEFGFDMTGRHLSTNGRCGFRPRSQRRVHGGFAPPSLFVRHSFESRAPTIASYSIVKILRSPSTALPIYSGSQPRSSWLPTLYNSTGFAARTGEQDVLAHLRQGY